MSELTAKDVMTTEVVTVAPEASLREIAEILIQRRISGVPVVDGQGAVVGIVSETDLLDEDRRRVHLPRTALFGVFLLPESVIREAYDQGETLTARDLMTHRVFTLSEDVPAREVADEMVGRKINRVPITRDGRLVGIVTRGDLLRALHPARQEAAE